MENEKQSINLEDRPGRRNTDIKHYDRVHSWLRYHYKKTGKCESETCEGKSKNTQFALKIGRDYEKDRSAYIELCVSCHVKYDDTESARLKKVASSNYLKRNHCARGHEYTTENTYMRKGKYRICRSCERTYVRKTRAKKDSALEAALTDE